MRKFLLSILSFFLVYACVAQADSGLTPQRDTLNYLVPATTNAYLDITDSIRQADSLQEARLQAEIDRLKASENEKKLELKMRLDSLKRASAARAIKLQHHIDSLRATTTGAPIIFMEDTLFFVYTKLGPYSPQLRAQHIQENLIKISEGESFDAEKLVVNETGTTHDVTYRSIIVLSVTAADAFWLDQPEHVIAREYRDIIETYILEYRENYGFFNTLTRVGLLLVVLIIIYIAIRLMNAGMTRLNVFAIRRSRKYIRGFKISSYEVIKPARMRQIIRFVLRVIKWILIVFILYISLPTIFSIFPATESLATRLFGYVLDPLTSIFMGFLGYIPELITIVVILVVVHYFMRFLKSMALEAKNGTIEFPGFYPEWAMPTFNLVRVVIYAFAFVLIFPFLPGSDSPVFKGVSIFFGLLISLGSTSAIANMVAGLVITYMRPFKIGDRVKIGDTVGDVVEKNLIVTRLITTKNEDVSIPNSAILSGSTINYSANAAERGLILHTTVTIGYDVSWRQVHELLVGAAQQIEGVANDPKPFVLQTSLDDFYVSYQINLYTHDPVNQTRIYSDLHGAIQDKFAEAGVEIMSPHYQAERDGTEVTVPKEFNPKRGKDSSDDTNAKH